MSSSFFIEKICSQNTKVMPLIRFKVKQNYRLTIEGKRILKELRKLRKTVLKDKSLTGKFEK